MVKAQWGVLAAGVAVAVVAFVIVSRPTGRLSAFSIDFNPFDSSHGHFDFDGDAAITARGAAFGLLAFTVVLAGTVFLVVKAGRALASRDKPRPREEGPREEGQVWPPPPHVTPP